MSRLVPPPSSTPLRISRRQPTFPTETAQETVLDAQVWKVGLDSSKDSPGLVAWSPTTGECHWFYVAQTKQQEEQPFATTWTRDREDEVVLDALPRPARLRTHSLDDLFLRRLTCHRLNVSCSTTTLGPCASIQRTRRLCEAAVDGLNRLILSRSKRYVDLVLEEYAFHHLKTTSLTTLAETCGLWKAELARHGYRWRTLSNTHVKANFGGHGSSTKLDLWIRFQTGFPWAAHCLSTYFGWEIAEEEARRRSLVHHCQKRKLVAVDNDNGPLPIDRSMTVPNPLQDLIDAFGLIWC